MRRVANAFVERLGREKIGRIAINHLPGLVEVEQGRAKGVDESVVGGQNAAVEHQPDFGGFG